ncbi:MAG: GHKL domain-containing protein [Desulfovibrionaceae bacterium]|nr:GHKL domain-containing protein [Desulfovibrionaceae bacterium]MBF0512528.1 GHKL domain-containing protein [Desulfovibrionaceae bacterium]
MTQPIDTAKYQVLRRNMIAVVVAVAIAPLFLINAILIYHYHVVYKDAVGERLAEMAAGRAKSVDAYLGDKIKMLGFLSASYPLEELKKTEFLSACLARLGERFPGAFEDLGLIDGSGEQVAYAGPYDLAGARYDRASWFLAALAAPETVSDVFTGLRGVAHFLVTERITDAAGGVHVLRATADLAGFSAMLGEARIGRTGAAFIINGQGQVQTGSGASGELFPGAAARILARGLVPGQAAAFELEGPPGQNFIYAAAPLTQAGWTLALRQDASDALAQLYNARIQSIIIFCAGAMGIVLMALVLSTRTVDRLAASEEERQAMLDKIVETGKLAAIGELAAGVAHEINNPVAIMIEEAGWIGDMLADGAAAQPQAEAEIRRAAGEITTQGKRCRDITHRLLSFARKAESQIIQADLAKVTAEIAGLARQKAKFAGVALEVRAAENLPPVLLSLSEMQQVLLNLINNAIDAVSASGREDGKIVVGLVQEGEKVLLRVADNGPGIAPEAAGRIFDPFFTTKKPGEGTGLGLSICHGLVAKMGGEIRVESTPGHGATFVVSFRTVDASRQNTTNQPDPPA